MTLAADKKRIQNKALLERLAALGGDLDEKEMNFHITWTWRAYSYKYEQFISMGEVGSSPPVPQSHESLLSPLIYHRWVPKGIDSLQELLAVSVPI